MKLTLRPLKHCQELFVMNIRVLFYATLMAVTTTAAMAQTPPIVQTAALATNTDPLVAYRAYNEAVTNGSLVDAARHAAQAWQLAETKWAATNPNTAGLAFNAAWSAALIGKSADRIDAARRAVELAPVSQEAYALAEAQFLLGYAEYFATDLKDRAAAAPKLAAAALPVEATWGDYLLVNALVNAANYGAVAGRSRATIAVADRALVSIERLSPNDNNSRALALLARAQGRLLSRVDQDEAIADLIQARVAYGPMRSVDDKTWGTLAAWEMASRSVVLTINSFQSTTGTRISSRSLRLLEMTPEQRKTVYFEPTSDAVEPTQCEGVRRDRRVGREISYPAGEAADLQVAGVLLRHDMDAQGGVINLRLLGAVPAGPFGESAMRAVQTWKYKFPPNVHPECMKGRNIAVSFAIN
jgi:TonB family protein